MITVAPQQFDKLIHVERIVRVVVGNIRNVARDVLPRRFGSGRRYRIRFLFRRQFALPGLPVFAVFQYRRRNDCCGQSRGQQHDRQYDPLKQIAAAPHGAPLNFARGPGHAAIRGKLRAD